MNKEYRMMNNIKLRSSIFLVPCSIFFLFCSFALLAADNDRLPERPNPPTLVNNLSKEFPDFLSASEQADLEQKLVRFSDSTSNQVVIVIVDDINDLDPEQYATAIGRKWGVGQKDKNNGIVILVKPTGGQGQRKIFISIGKGLEGAIPDAIANRIVDQEIVPHFKTGDNYGGLNAATDVLMSLAKGEYNYKDYQKGNSGTTYLPIIIFVIILVILISSRRRAGGAYSIGRRGMFYGAPFLGGGFGSGSSSSGGFGGFGGGSFGGGGAGGSW
jgi:uncharacterized protein